MKKSHAREYTLGPKDSAIVFRGDGTEEVYIPNCRTDEELALDSSMKVAHCVTSLHAKNCFDLVQTEMQTRLKKRRKTK